MLMAEKNISVPFHLFGFIRLNPAFPREGTDGTRIAWMHHQVRRVILTEVEIHPNGSVVKVTSLTGSSKRRLRNRWDLRMKDRGRVVKTMKQQGLGIGESYHRSREAWGTQRQCEFPLQRPGTLLVLSWRVRCFSLLVSSLRANATGICILRWDTSQRGNSHNRLLLLLPPRLMPLPLLLFV